MFTIVVWKIVKNLLVHAIDRKPGFSRLMDDFKTKKTEFVLCNEEYPVL